MFTADEFFIPLSLMTLFYMIQMSFFGLFSGVLSFFMVRRMNRMFGAGVVQKIMYWYGNMGAKHARIPSWNREWL